MYGVVKRAGQLQRPLKCRLKFFSLSKREREKKNQKNTEEDPREALHHEWASLMAGPQTRKRSRTAQRRQQSDSVSKTG